MTPEQWQVVSELFNEAIRLNPDERHTFLEERCKGKDDIRREVESLLRFRRDEDSLLHDTPPRHVLPHDAALDFQNWTERRLGNYQLKRVISAGGMGVVFLAKQQRPQRDVAVKVLYRGLLIGSARKRFEFEAEILGRLHHPNIAEIYEAGRAPLTPAPDDGPSAPMLFFAMEYVAGGLTLMDFVRHHQLDLRSRLHLFVQICEGVSYGHQQGIIHRDLKPSNILVTDHGDGKKTAPLPKIIDFGVAKCTDGDIAVSTMQTSAGDLIGTLQYMSPEQCGTDALAIDTRSDAYSLGVILYEMLTERVPYDVSNCTIQSAVRIISDTAPTAASQFNRKCRGDLDVILSKALEKRRTQRYASVADLADDIERYLRGDPIEARPPTRWVRSMRWISRHPLITTSVASLLIAVLIIMTSFQTARYLSEIPDHLSQSTDGTTVELVSRTGGVLHRWQTPPQHGIRKALYIPKSSIGEIVAIGYGEQKQNEVPGFITIYDARDPDNILWSDRPRIEDTPKRLRDSGLPEPNFSVSGIWLANIFKEIQEKELAVTYCLSGSSHHCLRIYRIQDGEVLYQLWQNGGIHSIHSPIDENAIYLTFTDARYKWSKSRISDASRRKIRCLAKLVLESQTRSTTYLNDRHGGYHDSVLWCKHLTPSELYNFHLTTDLLPGDTGPDTFKVLVSIDAKSENCAVFWEINDLGNEIRNTRGWNDNYKENQRQNSPTYPAPELVSYSPVNPTIKQQWLDDQGRK